MNTSHQLNIVRDNTAYKTGRLLVDLSLVLNLIALVVVMFFFKFNYPGLRLFIFACVGALIYAAALVVAREYLHAHFDRSDVLLRQFDPTQSYPENPFQSAGMR